MNNEREYHLTSDFAFKITLSLKKFPFIERIVVGLTNFTVKVLRKLKSKKQLSDDKIVLIIALHRIGDTVFTIPALRDIINYNKNSSVNILCYEETKPILLEEFNTNFLIGIKKEDLKFDRRFPGKETRKIVSDINPDIVYDLTGMPLSAVIILMTNARNVYGRNIKYLRALYDIYTPLRKTPHFFDFYYDVVRDTIQIEYQNKNFIFPVKNNDLKTIIIHPFGIRHAKEWNLRKFILLSDELSEKYEVIIVSPPNFLSIDVTEEIEKMENVRLKITNSLSDLIGVIKLGSLYIGNDSGPTYIASYLGLATFTIYGPTNPDFSLPFGDKHSYIMNRLKCSATVEKFCETLAGIYCPSNECMQQLSVDDVQTKLNEFINKLAE